MKELVSFITRVKDQIKQSGNARLIYYLLITAALLAAFLLLPEAEIAFVYNGF